MKKNKEVIKTWKLMIMAALPAIYLYMSNMVCYASSKVITGVENTGADIYEIIKGCAIGLLVVVLAVVAGILIIGTKNMKEAVKDNAYYIAAGCILLFAAPQLVDWIESAFEKAFQ